MAHNVARKAYSAEQLLALRHSASDETANQIEAKAQEGAIKGMFGVPLCSSLALVNPVTSFGLLSILLFQTLPYLQLAFSTCSRHIILCHDEFSRHSNQVIA